MSALDTTNVAPTSHVLPLSNVWREDKAEPSTHETLGSPEEILSNAPEREGPLFKVKKIIE